MSGRVGGAFSPPAIVSTQGTALTFTDILFGFVIKELFSRLQYWGTQPSVVRWQLVIGITLVLGSWIGFRRSMARSNYELKFFNLPSFRFITDQALVFMYFRISILTPEAANPKVRPVNLVQTTTMWVAVIFGLYLVWDFLGVLMSLSPKYKKIDQATKRKRPSPFRRTGRVLITLASGGLIAIVYARVEYGQPQRKRRPAACRSDDPAALVPVSCDAIMQLCGAPPYPFPTILPRRSTERRKDGTRRRPRSPALRSPSTLA